MGKKKKNKKKEYSELEVQFLWTIFLVWIYLYNQGIIWCSIFTVIFMSYVYEYVTWFSNISISVQQFKLKLYLLFRLLFLGIHIPLFHPLKEINRSAAKQDVLITLKAFKTVQAVQ